MGDPHLIAMRYYSNRSCTFIRCIFSEVSSSTQFLHSTFEDVAGLRVVDHGSRRGSEVTNGDGSTDELHAGDE